MADNANYAPNEHFPFFFAKKQTNKNTLILF